MWPTERGNIFGIQELHPHILHLALLAVGLTELLSLKIYDALLFLFSNPLMVEMCYIEHLFPFPVYRGKSRSALNIKIVHIFLEIYESIDRIKFLETSTLTAVSNFYEFLLTMWHFKHVQ